MTSHKSAGVPVRHCSHAGCPCSLRECDNQQSVRRNGSICFMPLVRKGSWRWMGWFLFVTRYGKSCKAGIATITVRGFQQRKCKDPFFSRCDFQPWAENSLELRMTKSSVHGRVNRKAEFNRRNLHKRCLISRHRYFGLFLKKAEAILEFWSRQEKKSSFTICRRQPHVFVALHLDVIW